MHNDLTSQLAAQVRDALARAAPLRIVGGGTKPFLGREGAGEALEVSGHRGIVNYHPAELVLSARAGTPLAEVEAVLAEQGQMLPFEPPHYGDRATLGGTIACGLSGPARAYRGAARDFVLGVSLINGRGEALRFGGEVMKNVAGYDVSRLQVGAMGTLGVLLDISLKVLPCTARQLTLVQERDAQESITLMNEWAGRPLPLSATCHDGARLYVRLSGAESAINAAHQRIGGELLNDGAAFWRRVSEQQHDFFQQGRPLWRMSLPAATPVLDVAGLCFMEWGGAQRWMVSDVPAEQLRRVVTEHGGHATLFRADEQSAVRFHPLPAALLALQARVKAAFDPKGILNPGRLYAEF